MLCLILCAEGVIEVGKVPYTRLADIHRYGMVFICKEIQQPKTFQL